MKVAALVCSVVGNERVSLTNGRSFPPMNDIQNVSCFEPLLRTLPSNAVFSVKR